MTSSELVTLFPKFEPYYRYNNNSFLLLHKKHIHPNHAIQLDLATVNYLFSCEEPTKILSKSTTNISLIKSLVLDQVLQIKDKNEEYVSGSTCFESLSRKYNHSSSINAIKHAWFFKESPLEEIVEKLYSYGMMPMHYSLQEKLEHPTNVIEWVDSKKIDSFLQNYDFTPISDENKYWFYWQRKNIDRKEDLPFKLYVSPEPKDLPFVFRKVAETSIKLSAPIFKLGSTSSGIHRPDKMVMYFKNWEELNSFAQSLLPSIENCKSQRVPFTYSLSPNGLLSYGIEPEDDDSVSFRIYISKLIAKTLKLYSFENSTLNINDILLKLNLNGIQTKKWTDYVN
ncbi:hypothetical protein AAON49_01285 [Pseudotenacibaculum sp. MALMAid0570]